MIVLAEITIANRHNTCAQVRKHQLAILSSCSFFAISRRREVVAACWLTLAAAFTA